MTSPVALSVPTDATFSWRRNVTLLRRRMNCSASPISPSRKVSTRGRWSTTVTFVPRRPNIDAYSTPITPAPTTVMLRGSRWWRLQQAVGVDHVLVVELHVLRPRGVGAGGDDDVGRGDLLGAVLVGDRRSCARPRTAPLPNSSPTRLRRNCSRTTCASAPTTRAARSIRNSIACALAPLGVERVGDVERAPGELVEHRHAQRLGGDRAGVDGDAAEALLALDDGDALAELGGLDGGLLAARARADDEEVEVHGASLTPRTRPSGYARRGQRDARSAGRKPARSAARPSTRAASRSSDFVCEAITASRSRAHALGHVGRQHGADVDALLERAARRSGRASRGVADHDRDRCARRRPPRRSPRARARCAAARRWPAASRPAAAARAAARAPPSRRRRRAAPSAVEPANVRACVGQVAGERAVAGREAAGGAERGAEAADDRRRPARAARRRRPRRARPARRRRARAPRRPCSAHVEAVRERDDRLERRGVAVEREHALGDDQRRAAVGVAQAPRELRRW